MFPFLRKQVHIFSSRTYQGARGRNPTQTGLGRKGELEELPGYCMRFKQSMNAKGKSIAGPQG